MPRSDPWSGTLQQCVCQVLRRCCLWHKCPDNCVCRGHPNPWQRRFLPSRSDSSRAGQPDQGAPSRSQRRLDRLAERSGTQRSVTASSCADGDRSVNLENGVYASSARRWVATNKNAAEVPVLFSPGQHVACTPRYCGVTAVRGGRSAARTASRAHRDRTGSDALRARGAPAFTPYRAEPPPAPFLRRFRFDQQGPLGRSQGKGGLKVRQHFEYLEWTIPKKRIDRICVPRSIGAHRIDGVP